MSLTLLLEIAGFTLVMELPKQTVHKLKINEYAKRVTACILVITKLLNFSQCYLKSVHFMMIIEKIKNAFFLKFEFMINEEQLTFYY